LKECIGEVEEMFKESEDKYIRIHGTEKRKWLRREILHQRGQG
jgi:ribulose bisphosphate carboxylase small subunit